MWTAILIMVVASASNNIGKALQKQATRNLPRLAMKKDILQQYLRSKTYLCGVVADIGGAILQIAAFASAPVSVLQPVSSVGLAILVVFSHFYLKERLRPAEWGAAALALSGVVGLGCSSEAHHHDHSHVTPSRVLFWFCILLGSLGVEVWWRQRRSGRHSSRQMHSAQAAAQAQADATACGLEAGACFGFSAASCRTGFLLSTKQNVLWAPLGLLLSVVLSSCGFLLQTRGLKAGNTIVVCTMAAASSMATGVLAGLVALGEHLPSTHSLRLVRLCSWLVILVGVTALGVGSGGLVEAVAALLAPLQLPPSLRRLLPRQLALLLAQRQAKADIRDIDPEALYSPNGSAGGVDRGVYSPNGAAGIYSPTSPGPGAWHPVSKV